ncbi:MAG: right-handed parallel beta-helix repeat-containing protein [Candidatus Bathyarchaeota archaeon]|nr:right-handed parallel beta-helix repeat-containing protein [Candidatus Bathyarchaeota archaeon]
MTAKNKIISSIVALFILAFSLLNLPFGSFLPIAKATYVEWDIEVNTVWTRVDSPFVVSRNVTIRAGVTLTIEPGVEVRFGGGPFTIRVDGTLYARGTQEKPVRFTSNREVPQPGDWSTILFNGTGQQPSILENCIVEYGINGITVNSGAAIVKTSTIQFNLKNGIIVLNGTVNVDQNTVQNNNEGGILIQGGNATIQKNSVISNMDGIILAGNLTASHVNITRNHISLNKNSGISITMETSGSGISIKENVVSSNFYGFYVSTNASTFITRNHIYNNDVGAFYKQGEKHAIRFNNIHGNVLGLDASPNARVNATQNYWGDKSGPYHETLNPKGKGNPVGGNGVNVDFIFFLTAQISHENSPPKAVLLVDKTLVAPGQEVTFVGSYSHDEGRVDQYFFDFGDGRNSGWTTLSLFFHAYHNIGTYNVKLMVMDDFGAVSEAALTTIQVVNLPPLNVKLTLSSPSIHRNGEVSITVQVLSNNMPVEGASVTLFAVKGGSFTSPSGITNSSGFFTTIFKAPDVMAITPIRIIARASMEGYADGSSFDYLEVVPPLKVDVAAVPSTVLAEGHSTVNVRVTWNNIPVSEVTVTISSSNGGNFTETEKLTDLNGEAAFAFTAPPVTSEASIMIFVRASKTGYMDGEGQTLLNVVPKILSLTVVAKRGTVVSEEEVDVIVSARYEGLPVKDVNLTVSAETVEWSSTSASTDAYGNATFTFKAPPVPQPTNITITATSSKPGFASTTNHTVVTVKPGNLTVRIMPSAYSVVSEKSVELTVQVKCGERPIPNASVTVSVNLGTLSETSAVTNASGYYRFSLWAPRTSETISITVTVNAEKYGYVAASQSEYLIVFPEKAEGLPWLTLLLILVPVVLVIVFVVLVKLGVIAISFGGKEEE